MADRAVARAGSVETGAGQNPLERGPVQSKLLVAGVPRMLAVQVISDPLADAVELYSGANMIPILQLPGFARWQVLGFE